MKLEPSLRARRPNGNWLRRLAAVVKQRPDGWVCWICGGDIDPDCPEWAGRWSLDHVLPLSRGGGNDVENLRPAHRGCNSHRGDGMRPIAAPPRRSRAW
jgi:5-methylcytosine-specific restriction endonuclease McrA